VYHPSDLKLIVTGPNALYAGDTSGNGVFRRVVVRNGLQANGMYAISVLGDSVDTITPDASDPYNVPNSQHYWLWITPEKEA
jgi:hypothetical protein